jgi:hypothetical protein
MARREGKGKGEESITKMRIKKAKVPWKKEFFRSIQGEHRLHGLTQRKRAQPMAGVPERHNPGSSTRDFSARRFRVR